MATTFSVEIQNADNLISRFQNIADSLPREIGNALTDSAESIVDNAQANAPVDTGYLWMHSPTLCRQWKQDKPNC
jgi:hypothetical protein